MLKETSHKGDAQQAGLENSMKRTYFPGVTDIVVVADPADIRTISNDFRFDRDFLGHGPVRNVQLLRKVARAFSLNGRLYPPLLPRADLSMATFLDGDLVSGGQVS